MSKCDPVELVDRPVGEVLQEAEELVDALEPAGGVLTKQGDGAVEADSGGDHVRGAVHLGFEPVQLLPAPGVQLAQVAGQAEKTSHAEGVHLLAGCVRFASVRGVVVAQERRELRICARRTARAAPKGFGVGSGLRPCLRERLEVRRS